jgi:hypothetical protein
MSMPKHIIIVSFTFSFISIACFVLLLLVSRIKCGTGARSTKKRTPACLLQSGGKLRVRHCKKAKNSKLVPTPARCRDSNRRIFERLFAAPHIFRSFPKGRIISYSEFFDGNFLSAGILQREPLTRRIRIRCIGCHPPGPLQRGR